MPLTLDTPTAINETIDLIELRSFTFDVEAQLIYIAYDEGYDDAGTFVPVFRDKVLTIPQDENVTFMTVWNNQNTGSKYRQLREAILKALANLANRPGTVDES